MIMIIIIMILPIIIGALGSVTGRLQKELEKLDNRNGFETIQKTCLLGSARIIRKVLDTPGIDLDGPLTVLGSLTELDSVLIQYLMLCTITIIMIIIKIIAP